MPAVPAVFLSPIIVSKTNALASTKLEGHTHAIIKSGHLSVASNTHCI